MSTSDTMNSGDEILLDMYVCTVNSCAAYSAKDINYLWAGMKQTRTLKRLLMEQLRLQSEHATTGARQVRQWRGKKMLFGKQLSLFRRK